MSKIIKTHRLTLSPIALTDVKVLHNIWIKPQVRQYLWDNEIIPEEQTQGIIKKSIEMFDSSGTGLWKVLYLEQIIGFCGYWFFHEPPELQILYGLDPEYYGQGMATEVTKAMLKYGFEELALEKIVGSTDAPNLASIRVMEKAGMFFEKQVKKNNLDTIYFSISKEQFNSY